ncbi:MAG: hypothetical protein K0Q49_1694 [Haloplasmataceae bacterium]|nr:hypothetical protein [Haloplasmataceae bacterium]
MIIGGDYMKKFLSIMLVAFVVVTLAACKTTTSETTGTTTATTTSGTTAATTVAPDTENPVISGADNITIKVGDTFNTMTGVTATDNVDGDLTDEIEVLGTVNTTQEGQIMLRYKVTDSAGNIAQVNRVVTVEYEGVKIGMLVNPDFAEGINGWDLFAGDGGVASTAGENEEGKVVITTPGWGGSYSVRLSQSAIKFEQGKTYEVTFEARALAPRHLFVQTGELLSAAPWFTKFDQGDLFFSLTTEMQEFSFKFTMTNATNEKGSLLFEMGKLMIDGVAEEIATTVYFDNVDIVESTPDADTAGPTITGATNKDVKVGAVFDQLAGISVSDNQDITLTPASIVITGSVDTNTPGTYNLTYTLIDASENVTTVTRVITVIAEIIIIDNSTFDTNTGWKTYMNDTNADAIVENGEAKVTIPQVGVELHSNQLFIENLSFENGKTYKVQFDARALIARPIIAKVEVPSAGYTVFGEQTFNLSTVNQTFEFEFTAAFMTDGAKLGFLMGDVADTTVVTTMFFDNVTITEVVKIVPNTTFDTNTGWTANYLGIDAPSTVENGLAKLVITEVGPDLWSNQLYAQNIVLENAVTYKVQFDAKALVARPIIAKVEVPSAGYATFGSTTVDLTTEMQTFTFEFTTTFATEAAKLGFLAGDVSDTTVVTTMFFDNVSIVVVE